MSGKLEIFLSRSKKFLQFNFWHQSANITPNCFGVGILIRGQIVLFVILHNYMIHIEKNTLKI